MRLKRVRVFGFKTFADRTEFSLEGDIVAVVGPNGCGKSNLVDAILWALGESNARHLRAIASQDVIFSGSSRRKPVGFAEVTLLFDNEDGALPIDTAEVSVTRRLSRGGDSEYFINRRSCRQRDVYELLADSGLGRAGYSIISQKEIDQALAASPEERRAWVDEAAGVQRYRTRKVESLKRLSAATEHLRRVEDILVELEAQREPLRLEAEVATRYRAASNALREIETGLLIRDLKSSIDELLVLNERLKASAELAKNEALRADVLDQEVVENRKSVELIDQRAEELRSKLQAAISALERSEAAIVLGQERLRSLAELESTLRSNEDAHVLAEFEEELRRTMDEESDATRFLDAIRAEVGGLGEEAVLLRQQLHECEKGLTEARRQHGERLKLEAEQEHRRVRRELALRELQGIEQDLPGLMEAEESSREQVKEAEGLLAAAQSRLSALDSTISSFQSEADASSAKTRSLLAEQAALLGRKEGIESTIHGHEGLSQGSKAVVEAASRGEIGGRFLPVGEAISTDRKVALAIETALGSSANDLIVESEHDAKEAISYLKNGRLGRATFHPVSLMSNALRGDLAEVLKAPSVLGRASDLVKCENWVRPVIETLLGSVVVVADLDAALSFARSGGWSQLVTLEGEVVHISGAVTGGISTKQHYGLVQRRSDLGDLERQLSQLEATVREAENERLRQAEKAGSAMAERQLRLNEVEKARKAVLEAEQYAHTLVMEVRAAERSREKLSNELATLVELNVPHQAIDIEFHQAARDELINRLAARSADANQAKSRLAEAEQRLAQARARTASVTRRLEAARASEAAKKVKLLNIGPEHERVSNDIAAHELEKVRWEATRSKYEIELSATLAERETLVSAGLQQLEESRSARDNVAAIGAANHQAELSRARAEARRATTAERLLEGYDLTEEDALGQLGQVDVPPDAQHLANRLRREIRAMGNVNIGAIEAFERLTSRHEELSAQRADILEGVEQVHSSIRELDKMTRERFMETFSRVQTAYAEMFQKLFGGGEGKVYLDREDSILESGIEIEVTLPGKKRQRLELLSGGERALCAAGFLFALLAVKPSPLVVLDEVDAPLDGRNVERFGDLLQEFARTTQFIVITHNPATIERSTVWLGVTMQEPGVSTLVPVRLPAAC